MSDLRFVRIRGRIVPIRKKVSDAVKDFNREKTDADRKTIVQSSKKFAWGAGAAFGVRSATGRYAIGTAKIGDKLFRVPVYTGGKISKVAGAAGVALSAGATVQNWRGSKGWGDFFGRQLITNPLRSFGGRAVTSSAGMFARRKLAKAAKGVADARAATPRDVTPTKAGLMLRKFRNHFDKIKRK